MAVAGCSRMETIRNRAAITRNGKGSGTNGATVPLIRIDVRMLVACGTDPFGCLVRAGKNRLACAVSTARRLHSRCKGVNVVLARTRITPSHTCHGTQPTDTHTRPWDGATAGCAQAHISSRSERHAEGLRAASASAGAALAPECACECRAIWASRSSLPAADGTRPASVCASSLAAAAWPSCPSVSGASAYLHTLEAHPYNSRICNPEQPGRTHTSSGWNCC